LIAWILIVLVGECLSAIGFHPWSILFKTSSPPIRA
jgi:hypothetical protein